MSRVLALTRVLMMGLAAVSAPALAEATQGRLFGTVVSVTSASTLDVQLPSGPIVTARLIGVDAPDPRAPVQSTQCFEAEASAKTSELLPVGASVGLERDIQDSDQYGRIPAYVWPVAGGSMVNEQLIAEGYARARAESMNVRHATRFTQAQQIAQASGLGLWSACAAGTEHTTDAQSAPC